MSFRPLPLLAAFALSACAASPIQNTTITKAANPNADAQLAQLFADYWEANLRHNPVTATFIGDPRYNDRLPNTLTAAWRAQDLAFEREWLARVNAVSTQGLSEQSLLSLDIFKREREQPHRVHTQRSDGFNLCEQGQGIPPRSPAMAARNKADDGGQ